MSCVEIPMYEEAPVRGYLIWSLAAVAVHLMVCDMMITASKGKKIVTTFGIKSRVTASPPFSAPLCSGSHSLVYTYLSLPYTSSEPEQQRDNIM